MAHYLATYEKTVAKLPDSLPPPSSSAPLRSYLLNFTAPLQHLIDFTYILTICRAKRRAELQYNIDMVHSQIQKIRNCLHSICRIVSA